MFKVWRAQGCSFPFSHRWLNFLFAESNDDCLGTIFDRFLFGGCKIHLLQKALHMVPVVRHNRILLFRPEVILDIDYVAYQRSETIPNAPGNKSHQRDAADDGRDMTILQVLQSVGQRRPKADVQAKTEDRQHEPHGAPVCYRDSCAYDEEDLGPEFMLVVDAEHEPENHHHDYRQEDS